MPIGQAVTPLTKAEVDYIREYIAKTRKPTLTSLATYFKCTPSALQRRAKESGILLYSKLAMEQARITQ